MLTNAIKSAKETALPLPYLIEELTRGNQDFFFIQIGACDGVLCDPIREYILKYKWKGILIEPIKHLFDRLKNNYKGVDNLIFENIAIADKNGFIDMYRYKENQNDLPFWYESTASLFLNFDIRHKDIIPDINQRIIKEQVKCMTFGSLLQKYSVKKIDLLLIDVEGYEYEIIKTIDFKLAKPKIIYYEHQCLTKDLYEKSKKIVIGNGYTVIKLEADTFAFLGSKSKKAKISINFWLNLFILLIGMIFRKLRKSAGSLHI